MTTTAEPTHSSEVRPDNGHPGQRPLNELLAVDREAVLQYPSLMAS